jgi:hypothetical protein
MGGKNIIKSFNLEDRILALSAQGMSSREIAARITKNDLVGKGSVSQPTVARFLKTVRKERGITARTIVDDYLKTSIPKDLELLDEVVKFHLTIFRGNVTILEKKGEKVEAAEIGIKERITASRDIHAILQTKMRFIGVDGDSGGTDLGDPVDLDKYKTTDDGEQKAGEDG